MEETLVPPSSLSSTSDHVIDDSLHLPPLPTLPLDLLSEILCRLPVKLLIKLRCLCKFFNTLISDSKFTKKHLHMSANHHHLILSSRDESHLMSYPLHSIFNSVTINATKLHLPFKQQSYFIVGSCQGILCLVPFRHPVVLWNPSIRNFTKLPSLENPIKVSYTSYGFGYVPLTDNYKVVAVLNHLRGNGPYHARIKVHTLGTNYWRMIEGNFPVAYDMSLKFVGCTLNWFVYSDPIYSVVSFNLVNESHRKLLPPNFGGEDGYHVSLGVLRDCLCIYGRSSAFHIVWLLKEYGNEESWIKLFCVPNRKYPFNYPYIKPIWISEEDQVLMECWSYLKQKKDYSVYGFKNGTFMIPMTKHINGWNTVYVESLVSPCF